MRISLSFRPDYVRPLERWRSPCCSLLFVVLPERKLLQRHR